MMLAGKAWVRYNACMKRSVFIVTLWLAQAAAAVGLAATSAAEQTDVQLESQLSAMLSSFNGTAGIYVRHLPSGRSASIRADEVFPTASMVKIPILLGLFARIERGDLDYHQIFTFRIAERQPSAGILNAFKDGETVDVAFLATLMMAFSDNDASLWCQELAGGGMIINAWLESHGFSHTRVNSRTDGRESAKEMYGWGQSTPREMAELLVRIHDRQAVSPAADDEMVRVLSRNYWDGNALAQVPPTVHTMSKGGSVGSTRSEVVLVDAPNGAYVFCVMTRDQKDKDWGRDNAGQILRRNLSRLIWQHFEPGSTWSPATGAERFR